MQSFTARRRCLSCALACSLSFGTGIAKSTAGLVLQRVPPLTVAEAPRYPQNLAHLELGARVESDPKVDEFPALLAGDPTSLCSLREGVTTLLISLPQTENIDSVAFLNAGMNGSVAIATASAKLPAGSPQWHDSQARDVSNGLITSRVGPTEAKYIRLIFDLRTPGRVGNLGIYSAAPVSDFTTPRPRKIAADEAAPKIDFADLHGQARIIFVSSGRDLRLANNMIDGQAGSAYTFAANDTTPATIIDLGRALPIRRISTFSTSGSASATFYVFDTLPGDNGANSLEMLRVDPQLPAGSRTVGTANDDGTGRVAVDFQETSARYVMVAWTPSGPTSNFAVAEIAVLGPVTSSTLLALNRISERSDDKNVRDPKDVRDSKDAKDFSKEIPGEGPGEEQPPAEGPPPPLPRPPPFVFIPKVTPTSF
jgi:hypothetical protein